MDEYAFISTRHQAVRFDGSTSMKVALQRWIDGEPWVRPALTTRDLGATLAIPRDRGYAYLEWTARYGHWIIRHPSGDFQSVTEEYFRENYAKIGYS